ncbi:MAG: FHA domain-containing protein [Pseudomonadota bacterium]
MGLDIASLMALAGIGSVFGLIGLILAGWMAWRIVEKAGLPGWTGLGAILLTLTAIGTIVPLVLLWVFAYMRWPRDEPAPAVLFHGAPGAEVPPRALGAPNAALADGRAWALSGSLPAGGIVAIVIDGALPSYLVTGAPGSHPGELSLADPSVGRPHARLLVAPGRLGLEDLGSGGGTFIDGARLLPEHGPRDISAARTVRFGAVELALSRS